MVYWFTDWLVHVMVHWCNDSLVQWFVGSWVHRCSLIRWVADSLACVFVDSLVPWFVPLLAHCFTGSMVLSFTTSLIHHVIDSFIYGLVRWFIASVVYWCDGLLSNWFIALLLHWFAMICFFYIAVSKSGLKLRWHFDFEVDMLRPTAACTFLGISTSKVLWGCALRILTWKCALHRNGVHLLITSTSKLVRQWEVFCAFWLPNVLRPTAVCNVLSLIPPDGFASAALGILFFDPLGPQSTGKTQWFPTS